MEITIFQLHDENIAEVKGSDILINNLDDGLQIMVDCSAQEAYKAILYQENISPDFFDLKTKLAGEILQKYTQYQFDIAIIGDFSVYDSKSLNDFIYESNKSRKINFVETREEALARLSNH
ncbi:DUF4180 domain-containing protein [Sphingobacterium sp. N143]|uniref:DUF4180 domain-containing protein n=1 Tax=Sphingobacterium sp. N143 TaxID=2746727 RepID=UPI002576725D|nr:DUF4180 domain-containing protein [Sphingobacterium sp. N143]MDM1296229.1 DUF4180 domain-containing protein [Sphingobacterium sp. N143]